MPLHFQFDTTIEQFAVFGNPVKHSRSPDIHTLFASQFDIALAYQAINIKEDEFDLAVREFAEAGGKGLNITVPFKGAAFQLCDELSERARVCRSVNTIWFNETLIYGDTTDGEGLVRDLQQNHQIELNDKRLLIMGAGGTVSPILSSLLDTSPESITIVNRTISKAENLAKQFGELGQLFTCAYDELNNTEFDLIINATSASLKGTMPDLPTSIIHKDTCCYDLMYSSEPTTFLKWAKEQGAKLCLDGLGMLVEQAASGFKIWHGKQPETTTVINALRNN